MKNIKLIVVISTVLLSSVFCAFATAQTTSPVTVTAWGMHYGGWVVYKYQVKNQGALPIDDFFIGFYPPTDTADGDAELKVGPYYPGGQSLWLPPSVSQSPVGWGVYLSFPDESATFSLRWIEAGYYKKHRPKAHEADMPIVQNPPNVIPAGATWDQFSVTLPKPDYAYVQGHANLFYGDNEITVQMEKGDSIKPTLKVEIEKVRKEDGFLTLHVEVEAKDNYDPLPDVALESITADQPLNAGDVVTEAYKGESQIKVRNVPGRTYQISYSATDASGNKTISSAFVTVPREREEKNEHEGKKDH